MNWEEEKSQLEDMQIRRGALIGALLLMVVVCAGIVLALI